MSAELTLVMLAVGGTAALVGAAHLLGFNKSEKIADNASAVRFVSNFAPKMVPRISVLARDRLNALVLCSQNALFLVTVLGDNPVVRQLTPSDVTQIDSGNVTIDVNDFGAPAIIFSAEPSALQPMMQAFNQGAFQ